MPEERRKVEAKIKQLLKELSVAQQCSLSEISRYGYTLSFVRKTPEGKLAVVQMDGSAITIDEDGDIEHNSGIRIRS
jgi:pyruvate/2-oxoglutarate dehydrogenase complex dihydrolipoamide acyltransferase (E2) component